MLLCKKKESLQYFSIPYIFIVFEGSGIIVVRLVRLFAFFSIKILAKFFIFFNVIASFSTA